MIRSIILLFFGAIFVLMALRSLRAQRLMERYALLYILVGIPFLVLAVWPDGIEELSRMLDIERYTMQSLIVGSFLLIIVFKLTSVISVQDRRINTLTQLVAIMMQKQSPREAQSPQGPRGPQSLMPPAAMDVLDPGAQREDRDAR